MTAAPAEGLWVFEEPSSGTRVAAMVGPAHPEPERARITRRVETLELRAGGKSLRYVVDTASVRLEILPAPNESRSVLTGPAGGAHPAGVYVITPLVVVASYEPCAASGREPRIRYLRRDPRGEIVTDVMLWRESPGGDGALR